MKRAVRGTTIALNKYLNTRFVPTENTIISITKTVHLMLLTKLTAVYSQSYEVQKPNVCAKGTCS